MKTMLIPMKIILIPTDFSKNAQKAADYALGLFDGPETEFVLLNTFYIPYAEAGVEYSANDTIAKETNRKLETEMQRILAAFPDMQGAIKTRFEIGDVVSVVKTLEERETVHAVVMGTKGASGLSEIVIGSRTAAMIDELDCPIFAIPEETRFSDLKNILFATDLEIMPKESELAIVKNLAKQHRSKILVVHVGDEKEQETLRNAIVRKELDFQFLNSAHDFKEINGDDVVTAIEDYLKKHPIDLMVTASKKTGLFQRLFHRSTSKKLAMHTETPMLIIHHQS